jgi:voltage-gated potassium channel
MRMVSEMLRPSVVEFLDGMLRDKQMNLRIEEVVIAEESKWIGTTLAKSQIREDTGALVLAIRKPDGSYLYNPSGDHLIEPGITLIVIGPAVELHRLKRNLP